MAKAVAKKTDAFPEVEYFPEVEQGSQEWLALRLGVPTASCFSIVMAEGKDGDPAKTRRDYLHKLAGEILTGTVAEGKVKTAAMIRGGEMEPRACDYYERTNFGVKLERVGFARRLLPSGRYVGCSPDRMMDKRRKALEVKTQAPHLTISDLVRGAGLPSQHRWQVYGTMLICGVDEVDLQLFYDNMPVQPKFTVQRHDKTIKELSDAIEVFDHELAGLVKKIRAMGGAR
jgi:hypothetical protein